MRWPVLAVFTLLLAASPAHARPGDLDRSFANGGRIAFPRDYGTVSGLALSDGTRPVLGVFPRRYDGIGHELLLTAGGKLARATALQAPVIGPPRFASGFALTRINRDPPQYRLAPVDGGAAVTLTIPDAQSFNQIAAFGVDRAGRSVLVVTDLQSGAVAVRFRPDGSLDTSYGLKGRVFLGNGFIPAADIARTGHLYVVRAARGWRILAFDSAGRPRSGFTETTLRTGRFAQLGVANAITAAPDGRVILAGSSVGGGWAARLLANGRTDRHFGTRGLHTVTRLSPNTVLRDPRGRILLAGLRRSARCCHQQASVVRLTSRGRADTKFGQRGIATKQLGALFGVRLIASDARYVAIDRRGRIVIAGTAYDDEYEIRDDVGTAYGAVARLLG